MTPKRSQPKAHASPPPTRLARLSSRVGELPRIVRILLVALFALAVTLAVSPLSDLIYDRYFFSMETRIAPALATAVIGLVMYLFGWWLMVGTVGERPAARPAVVWYFGVGVLAVVIVGYLVVSGVSLFNFEG